ALDPETVHEVLEVVLSLAKNESTMIIVTHEMAFAKAIADRVLFMEHGEIVEESRNPGEFFAHPKTERAQKFLQSFEYQGTKRCGK
ncbi:MAG TPA: amino acid ABC transporter ATP-binding protein, partial [Clostridiaceae bacterium]|nr:amino acid ABC transporter ATP-binding protein [Clostridiaceae bacterium]